MVYYTSDPFDDPSAPVVSLYGAQNPYDWAPTDINRGFRGKLYVLILPLNLLLSHQLLEDFLNSDLALDAFTIYSVYLIPQYTSDIQNAAIAIRSYHQSQPQAGNMDLAQGAGGDYRYLSVNTNGHGLPTLPPIIQVAMLRSRERQNGPPNGFAGITDDINAGRGGDYLYIIWKT